MDLKVDTCHFCGTKAYDEDADFCSNCGHSLINICMDEECKHDGELTELPPEVNYCPYCGSETLFFHQSKND